MALSIAVIPGDGIGKEVMPHGVAAVQKAATADGTDIAFEWFDFASVAHYREHGTMLPEDWQTTLGRFDAIYFGAVGWPDEVPDHVSLWGSLLQFRRVFDQYVNIRPCRILPGIVSPLRDRGPGDVDFVVVRENTEGEYSNAGGRLFDGTGREMAIQETVMTRTGVDRVMDFAFRTAQKRRGHLTSATKSNGISITMPFWDERFAANSSRYPDVEVDQFHIDILTAHFVQRPHTFDVVVASNLFGDILSDLGPACTGTIGVAPSANINPEGLFPSLFEPVHGSAPDIAGKGIANPIGQIWSGALMLEHLGLPAAARRITDAFEGVLADADASVTTPRRREHRHNPLVRRGDHLQDLTLCSAPFRSCNGATRPHPTGHHPAEHACPTHAHGSIEPSAGRPTAKARVRSLEDRRCAVALLSSSSFSSSSLPPISSSCRRTS
ncbi:tartrate dehydrogenase [Brevibacterium samyangense]|uniref:D-malate dehydrogenase (decarboxylating) n=1 Tax=Brevibacterium samyangense TaxID=366888 RepID=A0ABP5EVX0_9MICO